MNFNEVFLGHVPERVLIQAQDAVARRLLAEYGSVFVACGGAVPPDRIVFRDEEEVEAFQKALDKVEVEFGQIKIELQAAAANRLATAVEQARAGGASLTPRSTDSGRRTYSDTVALWQSRVEPALEHWVANERLSSEKADQIRALPPFKQVAEIFDLEANGMYFSKDLSKSIIFSVAPPGTSQHLSMLAFDVAEFNESRIRQILAENHWYQTVTSDLPHFTYLGAPESDLPKLGLRKVLANDRVFWVPGL